VGDHDFDVIIVGGGPGGLTAGMYCSRSNLNAVLFEKLFPGGQIINTGMVEDYPGFEEIEGPELARRFHDHALRFGLRIETEEVHEVRSEGPLRQIVVTGRGTYAAKTVILAAGGHPNLLKVPGEQEFSGKGVSYCAICDGAFFRGEVIAVVGGGDAAVEEGIFLTGYGSKVVIIHRRDRLRAAEVIQERARKNPKIEFVWNSVVERIGGDSKVTHVELRNTVTGERSRLDVGAVFVFVGFVPNSHLVRGDLRKTEAGYIITDTRMMTSIPGIFAVGDVRDQLTKQVTTAAGDGTTAAIAAYKYIEEHES
jgi:thioredoxin reductase (NADPH)